MSRNNDRRNARRQNNGSWQRASSNSNKMAAKAITKTGSEDPTAPRRGAAVAATGPDRPVNGRGSEESGRERLITPAFLPRNTGIATIVADGSTAGVSGRLAVGGPLGQRAVGCLCLGAWTHSLLPPRSCAAVSAEAARGHRAGALGAGLATRRGWRRRQGSRAPAIRGGLGAD